MFSELIFFICVRLQAELAIARDRIVEHSRNEVQLTANIASQVDKHTAETKILDHQILCLRTELQESQSGVGERHVLQETLNKLQTALALEETKSVTASQDNEGLSQKLVEISKELEECRAVGLETLQKETVRAVGLQNRVDG